MCVPVFVAVFLFEKKKKHVEFQIAAGYNRLLCFLWDVLAFPTIASGKVDSQIFCAFTDKYVDS